MNVENLAILANYLEGVPPPRFSMRDFAIDEYGEPLLIGAHECGTIACAAGHGPAAGFPIENDHNWLLYVERVFGLRPTSRGDAWRWCFAGAWSYIDDTPAGAAKRIHHLVKHGLPADSELQLRGHVPYMFA
jgi:hypothetical protein